MDQLFTSFEKFGLGGVLSWAGTVLLFLIIKWLLKFMDRLMDRMVEQQNQFNSLQSQWINALNGQTEQNKVFHESIQRGLEYQRQEHIKMMDLMAKCARQT